MSLITLTTDFGIKDHYVGALKGIIFKELPDANIVDISHHVSPFNITEAAYVLKNAYKHFPEGSVHMIGVDCEPNPENKHIALKLDGHFFVCPDNGVISMIVSDINPEQIVEINVPQFQKNSNHMLADFVQVACHILRGGKLEVVGKPLENYKELTEFQPVVQKGNNQITGSVIYIDNYGNVVTNISKKLFKDIGKGRKYEIVAKKYVFKKVYSKYSDIVDFTLPPDQRYKDGSRLAIFNSGNFLELAIYKSNLATVGGANSLLGLRYRDHIVVNFLDK
ncbi:SAM hydrolase/SAM-dependent halogenase family protein [Aureivirga marina]|uniref:SAM hydrolase/SAM-dependent halogenase family protein n=1 Tax=Aureivirga marina TaxID=1182451 RepID=UPI0018CB059F|nr:SAM-dependent chlorinase/fluorinase [Aureivirga marina]